MRESLLIFLLVYSRKKIEPRTLGNLNSLFERDLSGSDFRVDFLELLSDRTFESPNYRIFVSILNLGVHAQRKSLYNL